MLSSTRESATSEPAGTARPVRALSHGAIGLRRIARHRGAMVGAAVILVLLLCSFLAPFLARYDPNAPHFDTSLRPPSAAFPLGTDSFGRDILSRVVYGGRISLTVGAIAVLLSFAAGVPIGIAAGYYGGRLDDLIMRIIDVWLAFPDLLLAIGIVAVLGPGIQNVMLAIGVSGIPGVCRLARGSVLPVKEESYVEVARAVGGSEGRIIRVHILPNVLAPIVVLLTLRLGTRDPRRRGPQLPRARRAASHGRMGRHGLRGPSLPPASMVGVDHPGRRDLSQRDGRQRDRRRAARRPGSSASLTCARRCIRHAGGGRGERLRDVAGDPAAEEMERGDGRHSKQSHGSNWRLRRRRSRTCRGWRRRSASGAC